MLERSSPETAPAEHPQTANRPPDQRAVRRWQVLEEAEIVAKDDKIECQVQDISPVGANISLAQPLNVGDAVSLVLIGFGAVPAEVAWSDGHSAGLKFTYDEVQRGVMTDWLMLIVDM